MSPIVPLDLPKTKLNLSKEEGRIYVICLARKKKILLTPEEWVRQHFIAYFSDVLKYPKGLLTVEKGLNYGALDKRWDLAIFNIDQSCFMLLECKAPSISITQSVFEQSLAYYKGLQAQYLVLSNGLEHVILERSKGKNQFDVIDVFPEYPSFS